MVAVPGRKPAVGHRIRNPPGFSTTSSIKTGLGPAAPRNAASSAWFCGRWRSARNDSKLNRKTASKPVLYRPISAQYPSLTGCPPLAGGQFGGQCMLSVGAQKQHLSRRAARVVSGVEIRRSLAGCPPKDLPSADPIDVGRFAEGDEDAMTMALPAGCAFGAPFSGRAARPVVSADAREIRSISLRVARRSMQFRPMFAAKGRMPAPVANEVDWGSHAHRARLVEAIRGAPVMRHLRLPARTR